MKDRDALRAQLIEHEGIRLRVYRDSRGVNTIGVGRNLESVGISHDEAMLLLDNDIKACISDLASTFPWFEALDPIRQRALVDLRFNVGQKGFLGFAKFIAAMARGDYDAAARELVDSRWYTQVGRRAPRICWMVRTGREPEA